METIGFIGAGNMAEALIKGVINVKLYTPENVFISDIRAERLEFLHEKYGVIACEENGELTSKVQTVVLSIKPQKMTDALESIKDAIGSEKLVISIAAGIKVANITSVLGDVAIVRVMPNTPALIGQGAGALFGNERAKPMLNKAVEILSAVGKAVIVDDEDLIDAVTALSGSGPAYYFLLMEEMIKTGIRLGLPDDVAKDLVLQTAKGAGLLAVEADKNGENPSVLRQKVTSPGGTTEAALEVFKEGRISELISAAINKAYERSKELSK
ncbi:MAG: pyrroline-5-carboxylate reductase [Sedimentisphaerales bacterium]|nr:pyrroline-5-carboxylate reductase [Sedimentisphaerales bacterium]